jgi:tetrahydromethanopterin S-methyltransferase subunit G
MHLTPRGMQPTNNLDKERERAARIEKVKQRLKQSEGKARNDFNKSVGRDI